MEFTLVTGEVGMKASQIALAVYVRVMYARVMYVWHAAYVRSLAHPFLLLSLHSLGALYRSYSGCMRSLFFRRLMRSCGTEE